MCGAARLTFEFFLRETGCVDPLVHFSVHDEAAPHTRANIEKLCGSARLTFEFFFRGTGGVDLDVTRI